MPFVNRTGGTITGVFVHPQYGGQEHLPWEDQEIIDFINYEDPRTKAIKNLLKRVIELFSMLLAVWQVGIDKEIWANSDLSPEDRQTAQEWKSYLDQL